MERITCQHCWVAQVPILEVVPFQGSTIKTGHAVKATCAECGRYMKFLAQTPEVLAELDRQEAKRRLL